jgi:hypothetical protein
MAYHITSELNQPVVVDAAGLPLVLEATTAITAATATMPTTKSTPPVSIWACRVPAGLPGAKAPSAAKALETIIVIANRAAPIARMSFSSVMHK